MSLLTPTTTLFPYTTLFRSNAGNIFQFFADPVLQRFRVDQLQFNPAVFARRRVGERFVNAFVGVLQMNVFADRSEEHTSELQSRVDLVCRLLLEKKNYYY